MKLDLTQGQRLFKEASPGLATDQTVASLTRPLMPLNINSSIPHALETLRQSSLDQYPVVSANRLLMLLSEEALSAALISATPEEQDRLRLLPLSSILGSLFKSESPGSVLFDTVSIAGARSLFADNPRLSAVGVINQAGEYFGVLTRSDLLASTFKTLAPSRVGGMATPLGVYLTDGINSGGVGNLGLMLAGISLTSLFLVAIVATNLVNMTAVAHHIDLWSPLMWSLSRIMPTSAVDFVNNLQSVIPLLLMMLLLRAIPVAGYHAAEHQVVHCIERGEPLLPGNVASMPRPHPRCGTNLVAAVTLFGLFFSVFSGLLQSYTEAIVPAAIATFMTWRQVGTFLQQYFTTRPASQRQLASGIAAGEDLLQKYRQNTNRKGKFPLRIWRMGLLQVISGCALMGCLIWAVVNFFPQLAPYLQGLN